MRKAAAWNVTGIDRSTQALAEEAARRAGMTLADWLDEVVSEQAAGQGVGAEDVANDDPLESIGGRLERLASRDRAARRSRSTLASPGYSPRDAAEDDAGPTDSRVETALSKIEARAALNEQRTARALATVADWIERGASPGAAENARIAEAPAKERAEMERTAETRAAPARPPTVEPTKYEDIDQRLEALAKRMEAGLRSASSRPRPQSHNEPAAARAEPQRRPTAADDAGVENLGAERPLSNIEAEPLHAEIAAMRKSLADLAPRNAGVALEGALLDFGQRLAATRRAALNPEALKPIEDGLREALDALRRQNLQPAAGGVERDLSALNLKIDALARSSVDPELLDQIRRQSEDTRRQAAAAALQSTPLTRIEREVERLADRVERLATRPVPQADIDALARALDETRHKIERATPPSALASIAPRLAALTTRIDDALRAAAAPNTRPLDDLTRRLETARAPDAAPAPLDPRGDVASRARKLESTLANLHAKFDNAALASSSSSESLDATLKQLLSRLEDVAAGAAGPRAIDAAPFKDLGQRIDAVRASLDQLSDLSAHTRQLEAAFADLSEKLDASIGQSMKGAQLNSALQQLVRRIEDLAARPAAPQTLDAAPFRDLARRIDAVRVSLEQRGDFGEQARRVEAALAGMRDTIERSFNPAEANAAVNSTLQQLVGRLDDLVDRPPAGGAFDPAPFHDLALRIDAVRAALEQRGGFAGEAAGLENKLAELSDKLDASLRAASANEGVNANLQRIVARLEGIARQSGLAGSADLGAVRDLASRIDGLRSAMDRQAGLGPQLESLASDVQEIRGRLEAPRIGAPEAKQIIDAIQNLANRPPPNAAINLAPFHELARRIDAVRSAMDRQTDPGPQLASLASEVEEIRARLENSQIGAPEAKQIIDAIQSLADRSPANAAVDLAPFRELARRIDTVRTALEQHSGFTGEARGFEAKLTELNNNFGESLRAAYGVVDANLQRVMARLEEIARGPGLASSADLGALRNLASLVDSLRAAFEERGGFAGETRALEAKLGELSDKLDDSLRAAAENQTISENLQLILARLEGIARQPTSAGSADLGALHDLVSGVEGLRAGVEEIRSRQDAAPIGAAEVKTLIDVIQDLAERVDRQPAAPDLSAVEEMVREIASRSAAVDSPDVRALLRDVSEKIESGARFDVNALTDWMNRLEQRLQATDGARVERALRDLESRLASREYLSLDPRQVEAAADLIAQRLETQNSLGADAETMFRQIADIQQRLDALSGVSESNAALERTIGDLIAVFESTREHLQSAPMMERGDVGGLAEDLAELKTEQANADRRMAQRLNRVQEILEGLTDRLRELEDDRVAAPDGARRAAGSSGPALVARVDLAEIPDRPAAAPAAKSPPAAERPAAEPTSHDFLLEPGSGAPRPRKADDEVVEDRPKVNDLQAHIAAARRAAMAEISAKRDASAAATMAEATTRPGKSAPRGTQAFAALAQAKKVVGARRVPFLVGAAVLIAAATTAMYEMRGAHAPLSEKSEFVPAAPATTSPAQPSERKDKTDIKEKPAFDMAPTGSIDAPRAPTAVPTSAPSPKPSPEGPSAASKVSGDLIAAIPDGAPAALRSAAIAGDAGAETELGIRYLEGRTAPRDPKLASRWLELAANQGLPYAEYRLAALYEKGIGGPRDLPLARVWYQKSADAGNARAMHNLAVLNAQDAGAGKPDYGLAAIGFRNAAELGLRDSQFNLGVLYGRGLGTPQDFGQSWMWFSLAAQQGDADAAKKRDEVAARMDAKALAAAAKMYSDFKLKTPLPSANEIPTPPGGWDAKSVAPQAAKPAAPPPRTPAART